MVNKRFLWSFLAGVSLWVSLTQTGFAATTLIFPRASFDPDLLSGIAIVNPSDQDAEVTVTAYDTDGNPLAGPGVQNPITLTIPHGQQIAKVSGDLFGTGIDPATVAWLQATSAVDGLTGFHLLLNPSVTFMDGADLPVTSQKLIFNSVLIDGNHTTELNLVNPGDSGADVQIQLAGLTTAPIIKQLSIPSKGVIRLDAGTFFETTDISAGAYVAVDSNVELAGFELVRNGTADGSALNARRVSEKLSTLYFLQLSVLGPNKSELGVVNYSSSPVVLTISAYKPDGTLYDFNNLKNNPVARTLTGGESLREDVETMFGFFGDQPLDGWITVKSTSDAINGYLRYYSPDTGAEADVTSSAQGMTRALFSHYATAAPYSTGVAILNPGSLPANLRLLAFNALGEILGSLDTVLQPGQRVNKQLGAADFIPGAAGQIGGFIWIKSDLPVYVSSIISGSTSVSNIPAQGVPDTFNPDSSLATLKLTPPIAIVLPGSSQRFQVVGNAAAIWKVNGNVGGGGDAGTISSTGLFSAPKSVPARQVVTITADANAQSAGASADILSKTAFINGLSVIQSVAYLGTLRRMYAAELTALSSSANGLQGAAAEATGTVSQIYDVAPFVPQTLVAAFANANIVKIISFVATSGQEYLLLLDQSGGRITRLNTLTKDSVDVVTGLNQPTSMVFDPATGDLLVVEQDKITSIPETNLETGLSSAPVRNAARSDPLNGDSAQQYALNFSGATGIAVDRCTNKIYLSNPAGGSVEEYDPSTGLFRTVASGLLNPGHLLGIYRAGITCPNSFHLLIVERGANRVDLTIPSSGVVVTWLEAPGIEDIAFLPSGNSLYGHEGILLAQYSPELNGQIYLVPLNQLYDLEPPNPPDRNLVDHKTNITVTQTSSVESGAPGTTITYTATVTNLGPLKASGIILVDRLPGAAAFDSAKASQGSCAQSGPSVLCAIGPLSVQETVTITIKASIKGGTTSASITNTIDVSATEVDPDPVNNHSVETTGVLPAVPVRFKLTGPSGSVSVNDAVSITAAAVDSTGTVVPSYTGTIRLSSSDGDATLPSSYTFVSGDNGSHTFSGVKFRTGGDQTVTVTETGKASPLTGSITIRVIAGSLAQVELLGITSPVTAGVPQNLTVNLRDAEGNFVDKFSGTLHFSSSDPEAVLPTDSAINGVSSTYSGIVLNTAGTQTITVSAADTASQASGKITIKVIPNTPATIELSGITSPVTAGAPQSLTVNIRDAYGNLVGTGYSVHFSSSDSQAVLPPDNTNNNGSFTSTGVELRTAGTQTIAASVIGTSVTSTITVQVDPGVLGQVILSGIVSPVTARTPQSLTVTLRDSYGNLVGGFAGTVQFSSSDPQAVLPNPSPINGSSATYPGIQLRTAGTQSVTVTASTLNAPIQPAKAASAVTRINATTATGVLSLTVNPAAASTLVLSASTATPDAGAPFTLSATARDPYSNVATGYTGTVRFTSTNSLSLLPNDYTFTPADGGTHAFTNGVQPDLYSCGGLTITATDTVNASITGNVSVTVIGPISYFDVSGVPDPVTAGTQVTVTVVARDGCGSRLTGYVGTVHFTSTDSNAIPYLPPDYTFTPAESGSHTFSVTLFTAGQQTVEVNDTDVTKEAYGYLTVNVLPAAASQLLVYGIPVQAFTSDPYDVTVAALDPYGNIATGYLGTIHFTSTDPLATLPVDYTFTGQESTPGQVTFLGGVIFGTGGAAAPVPQTVTATDTVNPGITGSETVQVGFLGAPSGLRR